MSTYQNHVIPEITITQTDSPTVERDEVDLLTAAVNKIIDGSRRNSLESLIAVMNPRNGELHVASDAIQMEEGEKTALISVPQPKKRRRSFGYQDKKFDEDVPVLAETPKRKRWREYLNYVKLVLLSTTLIIAIIAYTTVPEHSRNFQHHSVNMFSSSVMNLGAHVHERPMLRVTVKGAFVQNSVPTVKSKNFYVSMQLKLCNGTKYIVEEHQLDLLPESFRASLPETDATFVFDLEPYEGNACDVRIIFSTDQLQSVSFSVQVNDMTRTFQYGVIYAAVILGGLYLLIIFDLCHRALAAMLAATVSISVLSIMNEKPTVDEVVQWIDTETLCLLFGMMVLVANLCETGFFDYVVVWAYRIAQGRVWPLLTMLCLSTAVISAFLDNVTTILLFTPITIRLSEVMHLNPKYVLIALIMFSNVGGTATAVGDPPNVIIVSNPEIQKAGIDFTIFTVHLGLGILLILAATCVMFVIMYRFNLLKLTLEDQPEVVEIKQEIQVWRRAAKNLSLYSRDESTVRKLLMKKVDVLQNMLKKRLASRRPTDEDYKASLLHLEQNYKILDWPLLLKTGIVLFLVIIMFFIHTAVPGINISLGWIALMGALLLLIAADLTELEHLFCWVEWSTLIFFAALFVVMEALGKMGLLDYIGNVTEGFILTVNQENRLVVSILLILWVSAVASSFIDNIPFTAVMLKIVLKLGSNPALGLPLQPLVWALAFGACLGGNGTLIGASANVVCAGVAEQHGYRFTFMEFFKIGFPTMLFTTSLATVYLSVCHVWFTWH